MVAFATNIFLIRVFGEVELACAMLKIMLILGLILFGLIYDLGGVSGQHRLGFQYWRNPGAFGQGYLVTGATGRFVRANSSFTFSGQKLSVHLVRLLLRLHQRYLLLRRSRDHRYSRGRDQEPTSKRPSSSQIHLCPSHSLLPPLALHRRSHRPFKRYETTHFDRKRRFVTIRHRC